MAVHQGRGGGRAARPRPTPTPTFGPGARRVPRRAPLQSEPPGGLVQPLNTWPHDRHDSRRSSSLRSAVIARDSPLRWPGGTGLASLPPLPVRRLPLRVRQHHKTIVFATARTRPIPDSCRPQDVVVTGASSDPQLRRVLAVVKARCSAPPPLRGALGLDDGSAHACPTPAHIGRCPTLTPYMLWSTTCPDSVGPKRPLTIPTPLRNGPGNTANTSPPARRPGRWRSGERVQLVVHREGDRPAGAPHPRVTRRPPCGSDSSYGSCGPAWTGESWPSTTIHETRWTVGLGIGARRVPRRASAPG